MNRSKLRVFNGKKLPFKKSGLLNTSAAHEVIACLNALMNVQVVSGSENKATLSDANLLIEVAAQSSGGINSGIIFRGAYSTGTDYAVGDLVYTEPDASTRIPWICLIENGPATAVHSPAFPEPGTVYWRCLAKFPSSSSSALTKYKITGHSTNHVTAVPWVSGSGWGGTAENIAKPYKLQFSYNTTASIDGVTINYGSYSTTNQTRIATIVGVDSEKQIIIPRYQADDVIFVADSNDTGVSVGGVALTKIDVNADGRAWARKYNQATF